MGGLGSGRRWGYSDRRTVGQCYALDINFMTRIGMFDHPGSWSQTLQWTDSTTGEEQTSIGVIWNPMQRWVYLNYVHVSSEEVINTTIQLTTTSLPWDGSRWWFKCPMAKGGKPCNMRVGKLYLPPREHRFGCRHCHNLTYQSSRDSRKPDCLWGGMEADGHRWVQSLASKEKMKQWDTRSAMLKQQRKHRQYDRLYYEGLARY